MKGRCLSVLFLVALVTVVQAQVEECPAEQETNWAIEQLLRHEDCHKFYKCTHGQPIEYVCPANLYFNLETWQCDWPFLVDCTDRNEPDLTTLAPIAPSSTSTTSAPTTTTTTTTPAPTTTSTTTTTTPAPTTTTTSTTPAPTTTTTTTTPAPTTTTTTTTPAPTTTTTTTTPAPTTTTTTTPAPTTTTTTTTPAPTTTTTPAPTTTTTTTTPAPTTTTITTTPAPTTTSSTTTHAPECEIDIGPKPTPQPEPEPEEEDIDFLLNGCPVDPHIHWLLPNTEDCNLFYYCVWGEKELRQCPPTLHFNPIIQVCDWPQSAGCTVSVNKHAEARRRLLDQILL